VKSHGVAVGISEGEGETERPLEGCDQDRDSGENHCIVQILRIVRLEPDGHTPPEVLDSLKIDEWLPHGERDGLRGEDHRVLGARRSTGEAKVLGVEGCGSLQIANLESDEVGAECGHGVRFCEWDQGAGSREQGAGSREQGADSMYQVP